MSFERTYSNRVVLQDQPAYAIIGSGGTILTYTIRHSEKDARPAYAIECAGIDPDRKPSDSILDMIWREISGPAGAYSARIAMREIEESAS